MHARAGATSGNAPPVYAPDAVTNVGPGPVKEYGDFLDSLFLLCGGGSTLETCEFGVRIGEFLGDDVPAAEQPGPASYPVQGKVT